MIRGQEEEGQDRQAQGGGHGAAQAEQDHHKASVRTLKHMKWRRLKG